jgi:hypothetical protein
LPAGSRIEQSYPCVTRSRRSAVESDPSRPYSSLLSRPGLPHARYGT